MYSQVSALPITQRRNSKESTVSGQAESHKQVWGNRHVKFILLLETADEDA